MSKLGERILTRRFSRRCFRECEAGNFLCILPVRFGGSVDAVSGSVRRNYQLVYWDLNNGSVDAVSGSVRRIG